MSEPGDLPGSGDLAGSNDPMWWRERGSAKAIPVEGGLAARSSRGAIGQTWWSARFIGVLESIGVGGRLSRGKKYARDGQVVSMRVEAGSVTAQVQGSRPRPYSARIGLTTFGKVEWAQVEQAMADSAWYAAKLLAGEMPSDIEDVFTSVGLTLFPASARDLSMDCNCPDHGVPCKHLAAVFYLLAESFDDDPFGILALRGRDRQTLLENVRVRRGGVPLPAVDRAAERPGPSDAGGRPGPSGVTGRPGPSGAGGTSEQAGADAQVPAYRALEDCLEDFYRLAGDLPALPAHVVASVPVDALLDQLPPVGLTVRGRPLVDLLRPAYQVFAAGYND
ncbi:MAG TPA: SWIM zinc finger family protein [Pseudonocardia sp.]|nr:SWIM zinc finger family protein [Pseudonocardia sp.]